MGKLILFELRKLVKSKYFYVIAIISIAFIIISGLTAKTINDLIAQENPDEVPNINSYTFIKSALAGTFTILIGIFVALYAAEDYSSGTLKNIYGRGYNRIAVYFSKYLVSLIGVLVISILTMLSAFIFGTAAWGGMRTDDNLFLIIFGQFICLAAYHSIFFAIAFSFGKPGAGIALNIIGPMAVSLLLTMLDAFIKNENIIISNYWIDAIFSNFTGTTDTAKVGYGIALAIVYLGISTAVGVFITRKRDVK